MNMSSNGLGNQELPVPIKSFSYRDMGAPPPFQVNEVRQAGTEQEPELSAARGFGKRSENSAECCPA